MLFSFTSTQTGPLPWTPGFPAEFKGPFIATAERFYNATESGFIVAQAVSGKEFTLHFFVFRFVKKITLLCMLPQGLLSLFSQEGETDHLLRDKRLRIRKDQFAFVSGTGSAWEIEVPKEQSLQILMTQFKEGMIDEYLPGFPVLQQMLANKSGNQIHGPVSALHEIKKEVKKLLYSHYEPYKLPIFFKNTVEDYFFYLLNRMSPADQHQKLVAAEWEMEAIYKVRNFILANIKEHHPSKELSERFNIIPFRLVVFFKREFGETPYSFLLNAKIDKVVELIESGRPMKDAAPEGGYTTTSFITAFKKRYGYTPGKYLGK